MNKDIDEDLFPDWKQQMYEEMDKYQEVLNKEKKARMLKR